ncbi:MAG: preprotein translocase subunit SecG [bacterium]|nr:preprotein translocase subunit SecG [bacterium]
MKILEYIMIILYLLDCVGLVVVVLMQEGKSGGLGALTGAADTYYAKNKGRTVEGALKKLTIALSVLFIVLSVVINLSVWN